MGGRGAWSSRYEVLNNNNVIQRVNNTKKYDIVDDKIYKFALKPDSKHYMDYINAGYTENDGEQLKRDLSKLYITGKKENIQYNEENGNIKFEISGELGKNKLRFTTGWQIDKNDDKARFITGYRK